MLLGIIVLTLLKNKALFSSLCIVGNNPSDSSVLFETFFSGIAEASNFSIYFGSKAKVSSAGKKVTANKLKSSDYGYNILSPVNVKANLNFAIHESKTFVVILVNAFYVSSLMLVKKNN